MVTRQSLLVMAWIAGLIASCGGGAASSADVASDGITWSDAIEATPDVDVRGKDAPDAPPDPGSDAVDTAETGTPAEVEASPEATETTETTDAVADPSPDSAPDVPPEADLPPFPDAGDAAAEVDPTPDTSATDPGQPDTAVPPPPLFDHAAIRDASTAACTFSNHRTAIKDGAILDAWDVSYLSWESVDGVLEPIVIRGFVARPIGSSTLPGVIHAHGLGGCAKETDATGPAALLGMVVLAYTGPGGGEGVEGCAVSEGKGAGADNGYHLFDTLTDPRESWFWGHPVAAMRGITCLQQRSDVDAQRIGMTGFSAGGVATLVVSGADDRVKAGVPLSACGHWEIATEAPKAWQHGLLQAAGLSTASPEWSALLAALDPALVASASKAPLLMVNGTSDEFFPLTAHVATLHDVTLAETRTSLVGNFDHGCYALSGGESASTIEDRATLRAKGGQRLWLRHWLTSDPAYAYVPAPPIVVVQPQAGGLLVTATVDSAGPALAIESVRFWWSLDDAFLWGNNELEEGSGMFSGVWYAALPIAPAANLVTFVDVQYKTSGLVPERFSISSVPIIPGGFVPHVRDQSSCL